MSGTIDIAPEELAEIRKRTNVDGNEEVVHLATREFLRLLQQLKAMSGKVDFEGNWQPLEKLEESENWREVS